MISQLEAMYKRLDDLNMPPAERELAKLRLAQGDAMASAILGAITAVKRLFAHTPSGTAHSKA